MTFSSGMDVSEVATAGFGLAFVVSLQIINSFPFWNEFFGILFFLSLVIAGITSAISIVEVIVSGIMVKLNVSRKKAVSFVCGAGFLVSLINITGAGLIYLDIVDNFINNFGILISGLLEVLLVGWLVKLHKIREENNLVSDFSVGQWWIVMIRFVTPIMLIYMSTINFIGEITQPYGDCPLHAVLSFGWGTIVLMLAAAFVLVYGVKWRLQQEVLGL